MKLYSHTGPVTGCFAHRVVWPLRHCSQDFPEHRLDLCLTDPSSRYDVYYLYNLLNSGSVQCVGKWKRHDGKLIVGLDDNLRNIPEWNGCAFEPDAFDWFEVALCLADMILVSTPHLAEAIGKPNKTVVARNLMEVESYQTKVHNKGSDKMRILWSGSHTHSADLDILCPVVDRVLTEFGPDQVEFIFIGSAPGESIKKWLHKGVYTENGVGLNLYPKLMATVKPQIVLAPLVDCDFNQCKCVTGDTLVVTPNGIKPIKKITEDRVDLVCLEGREQRVVNWFSYPNQPTIRVETEDGYSIEGTLTHRMRLSDGSWKPLGDLVQGDRLEVRPFEIKQKQYQSQSFPLFRSTRSEDGEFDCDSDMMPRVVINEDWGRFLGYVVGDGHIADRTIKISCSKDYPDVMEDVKRLFTSIGVRSDARLKEYRHGNVIRRTGEGPKGVDIGGFSTHLTDFLSKLGMLTEDRKKVFAVPSVILNSPKSVIREFLRGLFESDGTVSSQCGTTSFCSKSRVLASQVQTLLLGFGIKSRLSARYNSRYQRNYWVVSMGRQGSDLFHLNVGFISEKKRQRSEAILAKSHSNRYRKWHWDSAVTLIETNRSAPVYDVEVTADHYYLANGLVSHNSAIRVYEAGCLAAPVVASPVGEYALSVDHGVTGYLANSTEEWFEAIATLLENGDLREQMGNAGRQKAAELWDWNRWECRAEWRTAFQRAFDLCR